MKVLMVPGIGGSGEHHWQTLWEKDLGPSARRLRPGSWDAPEERDWLQALDRQADSETLLVAHSLGCLAVTAWLAERGSDAAAGAFLVAPPDRDGPSFPPQASSFRPGPAALPVPAVVLASSDDPFAELDTARALARTWGAAFTEVGALGHINEASGVGEWTAGRIELNAFLASLRLGSAAASTVRITRGDPPDGDVQRLVEEHLSDMFATSPAESVHALALTALTQPGMTLWNARDERGALLGIAALKHLSTREGEVKSMRTTGEARGTGVGGALLRQVIGEAMARGYERLLLETGTQDYFAAARRLYARAGFEETGPFADYSHDPNSTYLALRL